VLAGLTCPSSDRTLCQGVFQGRSVDQGATWHWTSYSDGFPRADIVDLEVQPQTLVIRAGTYGRSAYEVMTSSTCSQDSDCDDGDACNGVETCRAEGVCRAAANKVPSADICSHNLMVECDTNGGTVTLDGSCSSDPEGCSVSDQWASTTCTFDDATQVKPKAHCPLGANQVALTVEDDVGALSAPDTASVDVVDTTPPAVHCAVMKSLLTDNNHNLVNVGLSASAQDQCEGTLPISVRVYSDEDDQDPSEYYPGQDLNHLARRFSPDAKDIDLGSLRLRSERNGNNDGRVYLIVTSATDSSNNVAVDCCTVTVPLYPGKPSLKAVTNQAAMAKAFCLATNGAGPPGYVVVGDGPVLGPKQ